MHEFLPSVRLVCSKGVQTLFAAALSLQLLLPAVVSAQTEPVSYAIESPRASESLLLGITRAGKRLVAVGERGHILYSDDEGESWQQGRVPTRQLLTAVFFIDDTHGWAVGHDALILHSSDGGQNWVEQYSDQALEAPLLDIWFADRKRGFAVGAYGSMLRTDDGGASWDEIGGELDNEDGSHLNAITSVKSSGLFVVGEMGVMLRSTDGGDSWEAIDSPYEGSLFGVLPTHREHSLVAYGLRGHLYHSDDFGDSWQEIELSTPQGGKLRQGLADGALLDDGRLLVVGHGGAVLSSSDNGLSFSTKLHEDRLSYAGVAVRPDGSLLLVGQGGIHQAPASVNP